jgi:hypothetical protein
MSLPRQFASKTNTNTMMQPFNNYYNYYPSFRQQDEADQNMRRQQQHNPTAPYYPYSSLSLPHLHQIDRYYQNSPPRTYHRDDHNLSLPYNHHHYYPQSIGNYQSMDNNSEYHVNPVHPHHDRSLVSHYAHYLNDDFMHHHRSNDSALINSNSDYYDAPLSRTVDYSIGSSNLSFNSSPYLLHQTYNNNNNNIRSRVYSRNEQNYGARPLQLYNEHEYGNIGRSAFNDNTQNRYLSNVGDTNDMYLRTNNDAISSTRLSDNSAAARIRTSRRYEDDRSNYAYDDQYNYSNHAATLLTGIGTTTTDTII